MTEFEFVLDLLERGEISAYELSLNDIKNINKTDAVSAIWQRNKNLVNGSEVDMLRLRDITAHERSLDFLKSINNNKDVLRISKRIDDLVNGLDDSEGSKICKEYVCELEYLLAMYAYNEKQKIKLNIDKQQQDVAE